MAYGKGCEVIQSAWDAVSARWTAEVKSRYFSQVFLPLLSEAEGLYQRNDELERCAENCIRSLRI